MALSEPEVLLRFLNRLRDSVVATTGSLSEEEVREPKVPSGTNLLGVVQHLTGMERHWFQVVFAGEQLDINASMQVPATRTRDQVVTGYRAACAASDDIVRACPDLSALASTRNPGEEERVSLRQIVTHMVEETGRHAGHADILRELIDGATGL